MSKQVLLPVIITTAGEIQAACEAGLVLTGEREGSMELIGTDKQWKVFKNKLHEREL